MVQVEVLAALKWGWCNMPLDCITEWSLVGIRKSNQTYKILHQYLSGPTWQPANQNSPRKRPIDHCNHMCVLKMNSSWTASSKRKVDNLMNKSLPNEAEHILYAEWASDWQLHSGLHGDLLQRPSRQCSATPRLMYRSHCTAPGFPSQPAKQPSQILTYPTSPVTRQNIVHFLLRKTLSS